MMQAQVISTNSSVQFKMAAYWELLKPRLSFLVSFSCAFGFLLASQADTQWGRMLGIVLGGFLLSGASVAINQIIERDLDRLMTRTHRRPLPSGRISVNEAWGVALVAMAASVALLFVFTNALTVALSLLSMALYSWVYTPLKRVGPVAVFVGAFPGALPPLLGWIAYSGEITHEALIIFGIQFIWQFPHFWAIAWVADDDYKKAGFRLLPSGGGKDLNTAIQIMTYTMFLIPLSLLPAKFGITGLNSALVAVVCSVAFFAQTFSLMKTGSNQSARRIMFGSFLYLPVVQLSYLLDKI